MAVASGFQPTLARFPRYQELLALSEEGAPCKVALGWWLRWQTSISNQWLGEHLHLGHPCAFSRLLHQPLKPDRQRVTQVFMST